MKLLCGYEQIPCGNMRLKGSCSLTMVSFKMQPVKTKKNSVFFLPIKTLFTSHCSLVRALPPSSHAQGVTNCVRAQPVMSEESCKATEKSPEHPRVIRWMESAVLQIPCLRKMTTLFQSSSRSELSEQKKSSFLSEKQTML